MEWFGNLATALGENYQSLRQDGKKEEKNAEIRTQILNYKHLHPQQASYIFIRVLKSDVKTIGRKMVVPPDLTWLIFVGFIRKTYKLDPSKAFFIFIQPGNQLPKIEETFQATYDTHGNKETETIDIEIRLENTFG